MLHLCPALQGIRCRLNFDDLTKCTVKCEIPVCKVRVSICVWIISQVCVKPGFHIVVSVVSVMPVVRKKFIGQIYLYGNLLYKCSIQKKRQIQLAVRDRMNSICPLNFFRTMDTTDTTIWKPGLRLLQHVFLQSIFRRTIHDFYCLHSSPKVTLKSNLHCKCEGTLHDT